MRISLVSLRVWLVREVCDDSVCEVQCSKVRCSVVKSGASRQCDQMSKFKCVKTL